MKELEAYAPCVTYLVLMGGMANVVESAIPEWWISSHPTTRPGAPASICSFAPLPSETELGPGARAPLHHAAYGDETGAPQLHGHLPWGPPEIPPLSYVGRGSREGLGASTDVLATGNRAQTLLKLVKDRVCLPGCEHVSIKSVRRRSFVCVLDVV